MKSSGNRCGRICPDSYRGEETFDALYLGINSALPSCRRQAANSNWKADVTPTAKEIFLVHTLRGQPGAGPGFSHSQPFTS